MTESGFEMPPDHIVSQMRSTLDLSSPVIMTSYCWVQAGRVSCRYASGAHARWCRVARMVSRCVSAEVPDMKRKALSEAERSGARPMAPDLAESRSGHDSRGNAAAMPGRPMG